MNSNRSHIMRWKVMEGEVGSLQSVLPPDTSNAPGQTNNTHTLALHPPTYLKASEIPVFNPCGAVVSISGFQSSST